MKIKLMPRFFLIAGCLMLGLILFGSNLLLKKQVEVKIVDSKDSGRVLAVVNQGIGDRDQGSEGKYDLIGGDIGGEVGGAIGEPQNNADGVTQNNADISTYQPVTVAHTVKEGDTLQSIAEKYHADAQTIADFPNNGLQESLQLKVGQILIIPNGYINDSGMPPLPPIARGTGQFAWPAVGEITQYAYSWHQGSIDMAISLGTEIRAADDGTVKTVEHLTTGYGVHVVIDHGGNLTSLYGHLSETRVTPGQGVHKGDLLGLSGSTGHSTGPHLHFEVWRGAEPVDPMTLLPPQ